MTILTTRETMTKTAQDQLKLILSYSHSAKATRYWDSIFEDRNVSIIHSLNVLFCVLYSCLCFV